MNTLLLYILLAAVMIVIVPRWLLLRRRPAAGLEGPLAALELALRAGGGSRGELRQQLDGLALLQRRRIDGFGARLGRSRNPGPCAQGARRAGARLARLRNNGSSSNASANWRAPNGAPACRCARRSKRDCATCRPTRARRNWTLWCAPRHGREAGYAGDAPDRKFRQRHHHARAGAPGPGRHPRARGRASAACGISSTSSWRRFQAELRGLAGSSTRCSPTTGARPTWRRLPATTNPWNCRRSTGSDGGAGVAADRRENRRARTTNACSMHRSARTWRAYAPPDARERRVRQGERRGSVPSTYARTSRSRSCSFRPEGSAEVLRARLVEALKRDCRHRPGRCRRCWR